MKVWIDAQLPPAIARWLSATYEVDAVPLRDLGLRDAEDAQIFLAAREQGAAVMSKDRDFVDLALKHGPPPQIIWITSGNTTNARLQEILTRAWPAVIQLLGSGEQVVEVGDGTPPG